jgi:hypothetical protein
MSKGLPEAPKEESEAKEGLRAVRAGDGAPVFFGPRDCDGVGVKIVDVTNGPGVTVTLQNTGECKITLTNDAGTSIEIAPNDGGVIAVQNTLTRTCDKCEKKKCRGWFESR